MNDKKIGKMLNGKTIAVTGAAAGIGLGICKVCGAKGAQIIMLDSSEELENAASSLKELGLEVDYLQTDLQNQEALNRCALKISEKYKKVDVLISASMNSSTGKFASPAFNPTAENVFDINVKGTWLFLQAFLPLLKGNKSGGSIVILSSATGFICADSGTSAYAASKAALVGLTKSLAVELAQYRIRVNCICQGFIDIPEVRQAAFEKNPSEMEAIYQKIENKIPLGRLGTIEEIGSVTAFLASDDSSYITGLPLVVDGGNSLPESGISWGD